MSLRVCWHIDMLKFQFQNFAFLSVFIAILFDTSVMLFIVVVIVAIVVVVVVALNSHYDVGSGQRDNLLAALL